MSASHFDSRAALANPTTETVLVGALEVGDLVFPPHSTTPDPFRIRAIDRFPDGTINLFGTPGALLQRASFEPLGHYDGTVQTVQRVVLT